MILQQKYKSKKLIIPWIVDFTLKKIGLDTTEMMKMINWSKDGLEDTLRTNDASREEERIRAAEDEI